ncbi:hypothetical protein [Halorubrum tebenquichense]|uniref:hypothetical protein n=1 Tax=Halorubrum tebenquichense TaxID=119434 RepID=UPI001375B86E|nr:hypothetical protein [Halorubrum tebenquichense]
MTRRVTVSLRTARGRLVEDVDASLLATDDAVVDMARRQAGISPDDFRTGEVVV